MTQSDREQLQQVWCTVDCHTEIWR